MAESCATGWTFSQVRKADGQRVGGIGRGGFGQAEQRAHHERDLRLIRAAAADDRLLDLARRIFEHRQPALRRREDRRAPRRAHRDGGFVALDENDALHRATVRLVPVDDFRQPVVDGDQTRTRQQVGLVLDRAVFDTRIFSPPPLSSTAKPVARREGSMARTGIFSARVWDRADVLKDESARASMVAGSGGGGYPPAMASIATRTGDDGTTGLLFGQRVPKNHAPG